MNQKTVCIIPARGGSKRIPKKNILQLNRKPLVSYTIEAALDSSCFSDVIVSSDDDEILKAAEHCGATSDRRPHRLAEDTAKAVEVIGELLIRDGNSSRWDNVAMCLPTCPFRTADDVKKAMDLFLKEKNNCPRLIGVTQCDFPPQLALQKISNTPTVDMREPESYGFSTRSQDVEPLFYPNGSIYISTVEEYLHKNTFFGRPMLSYEMPPERSLDIDYPYQFKIAESLMKMIEDQKQTGKRSNEI